jgi:hypothetical protein
LRQTSRATVGPRHRPRGALTSRRCARAGGIFFYKFFMREDGYLKEWQARSVALARVALTHASLRAPTTTRARALPPPLRAPPRLRHAHAPAAHRRRATT